eukprot:SAG31_NODE_27403_length_426_cov_1.302752_1_plen_33_part_10
MSGDNAQGEPPQGAESVESLQVETPYERRLRRL